MKLSVCLIVKNEEKVLNRCLDCVKQFADEIIVVDTGSTDSTIDIAKKYTKNVYHFDWVNDFSLARNFAFSLANGEYLMWIDADDVILQKDIAKINKLKCNLTAETYMLKYQIAFDENNNPTFEFYRERIVKNCKKAKFEGFVHEVIVPFGRIEFLDISIIHQKNNKNDEKRNLKLYQWHLKNGKIFNSREMFYYSKEMFYHKYYTKTIKTLKKYLKMPNKFLPNLIEAHLIIADCYLTKNQLTDSKKSLLKTFIYSSQNPIVCCKLGNISILENDYKNAIFWFKNALNCTKNTKTGEFLQNDYYDFIPYLQLSFCYYNIKDYQNFKKFHLKAKSIKPNDKAIIHNQKFIVD